MDWRLHNLHLELDLVIKSNFSKFPLTDLIMNPNLPNPQESKSLQLHQIANIILTVVLGGGITSCASFILQTNNSIVLLSEKMNTLAQITEKITTKMDRFDERLRSQEMKK